MLKLVNVESWTGKPDGLGRFLLNTNRMSGIRAVGATKSSFFFEEKLDKRILPILLITHTPASIKASADVVPVHVFTSIDVYEGDDVTKTPVATLFRVSDIVSGFPDPTLATRSYLNVVESGRIRRIRCNRTLIKIMGIAIRTSTSTLTEIPA